MTEQPAIPCPECGDPLYHRVDCSRYESFARKELRSALASQPEHSEEAREDTMCSHCGRLDGRPHRADCPFSRDEAAPYPEPDEPIPGVDGDRAALYGPESGSDAEVAASLLTMEDITGLMPTQREALRLAADRLLARPVLSEEIKSLWVEIGPEQIEAIRTELLKREADPADNAAPKREICKCALVTAKEGQRLREIAGYIEDKGEWPSDAAFLRTLAATALEANQGLRERLSRADGSDGDLTVLQAAQDSVEWTSGPPGLDELQHAIGVFIEAALDQDTCPTCGGSEEVESLEGDWLPCPDCTKKQGKPCNHRWRDFPALDINPPHYFRECVECGLRQSREGFGRNADGSQIPATDWVDERGGTGKKQGGGER